MPILNIGDTATNYEQEITVNNVRFATEIDEEDNEYLIAVAPPDNQYVIIDITIKNLLADEIIKIAPSIDFEVIDFDGYTYDQDFDEPASSFIKNLPECATFRGLPFTVYFKNGKVAAATTSIQSKAQVTDILDKELGKA